MTRPVRAGLVGCGRLAERGYLPAFARATDIELVAVADVDPGRRRSLAPGLPAFSGLAGLVDGVEVDLVVLAHPAAHHVEDACHAAAAGVASLIEKPPALSAAEAEPLLALEPPAWMGFNRRFELATAAARTTLVRDPPAAVELEMSILPQAWGALDGSEGVLLDLGPHLVDLASWLTGREAVRVRVASATAAEADFELDLGGPLAHVRISHGRAWHERARAQAGDGPWVTLLERGGRARRLVSRLWPGGSGPLVDSLAAQLTAVARAVRGEPDARLAGAADGVAMLRVLDAVAGARGPDWITL
jgi:predicted dehydrogenase